MCVHDSVNESSSERITFSILCDSSTKGLQWSSLVSRVNKNNDFLSGDGISRGDSMTFYSLDFYRKNQFVSWKGCLGGRKYTCRLSKGKVSLQERRHTQKEPAKKRRPLFFSPFSGVDVVIVRCFLNNIISALPSLTQTHFSTDHM
jgi:hypothetical protein